MADNSSSVTQANKTSLTNHTIAETTVTNHSHSSQPVASHSLTSHVTAAANTSQNCFVPPAADQHLPYVGRVLFLSSNVCYCVFTEKCVCLLFTYSFIIVYVIQHSVFIVYL